MLGAKFGVDLKMWQIAVKCVQLFVCGCIHVDACLTMINALKLLSLSKIDKNVLEQITTFTVFK